jgi:hypothetical protein
MCDRKLDREVAQFVLGLTLREIKVDWYPLPITLFIRELNGEEFIEYTFDKNACNAMVFKDNQGEPGGYVEPLPFFSSDIEQAWKIVELLQKNELFLAAISRITELSNEEAAEKICHVAVELMRGES